MASDRKPKRSAAKKTLPKAERVELAFNVYVGLGDSRSLKQVAAICAKKHGRGFSGRTLENWSAEFNWDQRLAFELRQRKQQHAQARLEERQKKEQGLVELKDYVYGRALSDLKAAGGGLLALLKTAFVEGAEGLQLDPRIRVRNAREFIAVARAVLEIAPLYKGLVAGAQDLEALVGFEDYAAAIATERGEPLSAGERADLKQRFGLLLSEADRLRLAQQIGEEPGGAEAEQEDLISALRRLQSAEENPEVGQA